MISYIETRSKQTADLSFSIPTDESIGGMLFDISGFDNPFRNYPLLYNNFKNNTVQCIRNMDDAELLGIEDNDFLNGLLYYHVSQFYDYIGDNQPLYIVISDCSDGWDVIQAMQQETSGKMFQIGVWTSQSIWQKNTDDSIGFTSLIKNLQSQADEICGKIGSSTHMTTPLNIILFGNSNYVSGGQISFKQVPNAMVLECPKVSVVLAQNGSTAIHKMQQNNPNQAPVSAMGFVMACLALCSAEENIGSLQKCDLNKNEGFNYPELGFGSGYAQIADVNVIWKNTITGNGYIIPVEYDGLESSYFFSNDQTLSEGDFSSIANNRVMHKCRRCVCTALIPYINSHHIYTPGTQNISATSIALITDAINTLLDSTMKNKEGQDQIDGRSVTFLDNDEVLENDTIGISLSISPVNYSGYLEEEVSSSANQ